MTVMTTVVRLYLAYLQRVVELGISPWLAVPAARLGMVDAVRRVEYMQVDRQVQKTQRLSDS